jgi:hypothetical protein
MKTYNNIVVAYLMAKYRVRMAFAKLQDRADSLRRRIYALRYR